MDAKEHSLHVGTFDWIVCSIYLVSIGRSVDRMRVYFKIIVIKFINEFSLTSVLHLYLSV